MRRHGSDNAFNSSDHNYCKRQLTSELSPVTVVIEWGDSGRQCWSLSQGSNLQLPVSRKLEPWAAQSSMSPETVGLLPCGSSFLCALFVVSATRCFAQQLPLCALLCLVTEYYFSTL